MIYGYQNYLQLSKSFSAENWLLIFYNQNIDYKKNNVLSVYWLWTLNE